MSCHWVRFIPSNLSNQIKSWSMKFDSFYDCLILYKLVIEIVGQKKKKKGMVGEEKKWSSKYIEKYRNKACMRNLCLKTIFAPLELILYLKDTKVKWFVGLNKFWRRKHLNTMFFFQNLKNTLRSLNIEMNWIKVL